MIAIKYSFLLLFGACFLACSRTPDYTEGESNICEVHHIAMSKRTVPFMHGMVPMSRVEGDSGEWKQRMDLYPHPGDCQPATNIMLPGEEGQVVVYVCKECKAKKASMNRGSN